MNWISRSAGCYLPFALILLSSAGVCYFSWAKQQENWQKLQRLKLHISASEQQSISRSAELELMLDVLEKTRVLPDLERFDPARWLSAIKGVSLASVDPKSVRARVLTNSLVVLNTRADQSVIVVPIEFDLLVGDKALGVAAVGGYGDSLGPYSSIDNCHLQGVKQQNIDRGLRLRCRVLKYAIQGGPS